LIGVHKMDTYWIVWFFRHFEYKKATILGFQDG